MTITEVMTKQSWLRRLIPFQSINQLLMYIAINAVAVLLVMAIINAFEFEVVPLQFIAIGTLAGSSAILPLLAPSTFEIICDSQVEVQRIRALLFDEIKRQGYHLIHRSGGSYRFGVRFLRSIQWKENEISISECSPCFRIGGPLAAMKIINLSMKKKSW